MGRLWKKTERGVWGDRKFRDLSAAPPNGQTLWLYLLTGDLTSQIPGVVVAGQAALAEKLRWPLACAGDCPGHCCFQKAFSEIVDRDMAKADWDAGIVVLNKALMDESGKPRSTAKPQSPNVLKNWVGAWEDLPDSPLKDELLTTMEAFAEALGKAFAKAFAKAFGKGFAKGCAPASGKPSGDQREIEIEKEIISPEASPPRAPARDPGGPAPDPYTAPEHAAPPPPAPPPTAASQGAPPIALVVPGDERARRRREIIAAVVPAHVQAFNRVRAALRLEVPAMQPLGDPAERALLKLLDALPVLDDFETVARHVLAVREAEAMRTRSVRYLGASVWGDSCFSFAKGMTLEEATQPERAAPIGRGNAARARPKTGLGGLLDTMAQDQDEPLAMQETA